MLESKTHSVCLAASLLMCLLSCSQTSRAQDEQHSNPPPTTEYRIQIADVIKVDVLKEPEITRTVPVDQKGNIHLPLIPEVKAAGLTALQLASLVREKLLSELPTPQVTITVIEMNSPSAPSVELVRRVLRPINPPSYQLRDVP
jgi:polysaccharide export outer membrane protein